MQRAMGISVHTGWAACVVVAGSPAKPEIVANEAIQILGDADRFCFHRAAEMERARAEKWIAATRQQAVVNAKQALKSLVAQQVSACAIVAREGDAGDLAHVLALHPRLHLAEGCFYRDVLRDALAIPVRIIPPAKLDPSTVGRLAKPPWGRDQKLAALAAWMVLEH